MQHWFITKVKVLMVRYFGLACMRIVIAMFLSLKYVIVKKSTGVVTEKFVTVFY